jgi:hypothetical protein
MLKGTPTEVVTDAAAIYPGDRHDVLQFAALLLARLGGRARLTSTITTVIVYI